MHGAPLRGDGTDHDPRELSVVRATWGDALPQQECFGHPALCAALRGACMAGCYARVTWTADARMLRSLHCAEGVRAGVLAVYLRSRRRWSWEFVRANGGRPGQAMRPAWMEWPRIRLPSAGRAGTETTCCSISEGKRLAPGRGLRRPRLPAAAGAPPSRRRAAGLRLSRVGFGLETLTSKTCLYFKLAAW